MFIDRNLNIFEMPVVTSWIYRVNVIPIKISASYFVDFYKLTFKSNAKVKDTILKKNKVRDLTLLNLKGFCKATIV